MPNDVRVPWVGTLPTAPSDSTSWAPLPLANGW